MLVKWNGHWFSIIRFSIWNFLPPINIVHLHCLSQHSTLAEYDTRIKLNLQLELKWERCCIDNWIAISNQIRLNVKKLGMGYFKIQTARIYWAAWSINNIRAEKWTIWFIMSDFSLQYTQTMPIWAINKWVVQPISF